MIFRVILRFQKKNAARVSLTTETVSDAHHEKEAVLKAWLRVLHSAPGATFVGAEVVR